jgi:GcrA cell cycle regulator
MHDALTSETWTDERVDLFKQLWADGLTAPQIANILGVTRNAVLGKRLRLKLPERLRTPPAKPRNRPTRLYARKYPTIRYRNPLAEAPAMAARENPCSLLDLDDKRCHWPNGHPSEPSFYFCGGVVERGSYCDFHSRVAYQKPAPRKDKRPFIVRSAA